MYGGGRPRICPREMCFPTATGPPSELASTRKVANIESTSCQAALLLLYESAVLLTLDSRYGNCPASGLAKVVMMAKTTKSHCARVCRALMKQIRQFDLRQSNNNQMLSKGLIELECLSRYLNDHGD